MSCLEVTSQTILVPEARHRHGRGRYLLASVGLVLNEALKINSCKVVDTIGRGPALAFPASVDRVPCPACGRSRQTGTNYCPHCGSAARVDPVRESPVVHPIDSAARAAIEGPVLAAYEAELRRIGGGR